MSNIFLSDLQEKEIISIETGLNYGHIVDAQISSDGLYMYTDGHRNPKVMITYSSTEALNPQVDLILGAGNSNNSDYKNRFFIQKGTDRTGLWYYDSNGKMSGLTFMDGGKIVVHGEGFSYTSIVNAVWG